MIEIEKQDALYTAFWNIQILNFVLVSDFAFRISELVRRVYDATIRKG
jgi:hypothetical protein